MELRPMSRSKALHAAGYDPTTRTLRLRFRNGGLYDYRNVPERVFEELCTSAHPWTEWQQHIKATYDCDRLE
jgi:hypothetical protein